MTSSQILNVDPKITIDNSLVSYEHVKYKPYNTHTFSYNDSIKFIIANQDLYTHVQGSYLKLQGKIINGDVNSRSQFVNFGPALLWDSIALKLGDKEIIRSRDVGLTALMKGYPSLTQVEMKNLADAGWSLDNDKRPYMNAANEFEVLLPLNILLGFAEDFAALILNMKIELELVRKRDDDDALLTTAAVATNAAPIDGKVEITSIEWYVPHVTVSDRERMNLLKELKSRKRMHFRAWSMYQFPGVPQTTKFFWPLATNVTRPRYVILGFQTDRAQNQKRDSSKFDNVDLMYARLMLNNRQYPREKIETNFDKKQDLQLYREFKDFINEYYSNYKEGCGLDLEQFRDVCPMWIFNCSKQAETVKTGPVDLVIEMEARKNFPRETNAQAVVLDEHSVEYHPLSCEVREVFY